MQSELYIHKREIVAKSQFRILLWVTLGTLWLQDLLDDVSGAIHGSLPSQSLGRSLSDANLMFEVGVTLLLACSRSVVLLTMTIKFLLGGVDIDKDNNIILLDLEMASMRQGRAFLARINDNIPKTLSSMEEMVKALEDQRGALPLAASHFESLILGMVYSAHQAKLQREDQEKWGEVLTRLANVTVNELRRPEAITTFS